VLLYWLTGFGLISAVLLLVFMLREARFTR
jgi:hypothetical protein